MDRTFPSPPLDILLVDDSPSDVELTTLALKEGIVSSRISVAEDGDEALSFLRREGPYTHAPRPDLILLDLNLPRKDGRETLAELAADPTLRQIPVVIVTVSDSDRDLLKRYNLAPECYCVKPIDFDSFLRAVRASGIAAPLASLPFPPPEAPTSREIIRVLLVEDNPADAELMCEELRTSEQIAFTVAHVETFPDTLTSLEEATFDVIVLDLMIVQADGLSASIEELRKRANIPVVVLTGMDDESMGVRAVQLGAQDYLVKGRLASDLLIRSIRFAVERHQRRNIEEQLYHSQKLEEIGRLAGGIAHDFNNILTVIMGYSALAQLSPAIPSDERTYLEGIEKAAHHAATLTHQLLAFARKQAISPQVVQLNPLIQGMEPMLRRILKENVELRMEFAPDLAVVKIDPGQVEQVLINLIVNACDAMPQGGRIVLETRNLYLDKSAVNRYGLPPGIYVRLSVRDNGFGMTEEVRTRIFEPFYTTKAPGKGTGLGLATCYGIIRQNQGAISVESVLGQGTVFHIHLPMAPSETVQAVVRAVSAPMPSGAETVLLVEDEPHVRDIAAHTLRSLGYSVQEASDGSEAVEIAKRLPALHLLLTDVVMPRMSGPLVREQVRSLHPDTRVLYMTGYANGMLDQDEVRQAEVASLQKPFTPETLARKVREALDSPRCVLVPGQTPV